MLSSRPTPMRITKVSTAVAKACQSTLVASLPGSSCPVHDGHGRGQPPVGYRNPGVRGHRHRRADPGHDFEGDLRLAERQRLFGTAPEHQRVAALEPDHPFARAGGFDQQVVDSLLRAAGSVGVVFAHIDEFGSGVAFAEQHRVDQPIAGDQLSFPEAAQPLHGDEFRIARPGPHQRDEA